MKYTKFVIENFKGITGPVVIDLSLKNNIYPLVGLNESGKTSILEAINFFEKGIADNNAHTLIHKAEKSGFTGEIYVEATISITEDEQEKMKEYIKKEYGITISSNFLNFSIKKYIKFKDSKRIESGLSWKIGLKGRIGKSKKDVLIYNKDPEKWNRITAYISSQLPSILYYPNFLYSFPEKIYLDENQHDGEDQKVYRAVLQDILTYCSNESSIYTIKTHLLDRLLENSQQSMEAVQATLLKISNVLNQQIIQSRKDIFQLDGQDRRIVARCGSENFGEDNHLRFYISINIEQSDGLYSLSERSLGFRWFFSFLIFTEFRKVRGKEGQEILFLLDEPASNLHQNCQKQLLDLFKEIASTTKIIYSTHSHYLINPADLLTTYIVRNTAMSYEGIGNNAGNTNIECILFKKFVSNYKDQESHYKPILDAIDYAQSYLEQTTNMVYLEGKNDYYTFKYMAKILKIDITKINFFPGASVDKYDSIFRLNISTGTRFIAIFDGDKGGINAKKRYINEISIELNNLIFTLNDISESYNGFTTESLFSESDRMKIINLVDKDETKYNKQCFNYGIQELFLSGKELNFSKETKENFTNVINFIIRKFKKKEMQ